MENIKNEKMTKSRKENGARVEDFYENTRMRYINSNWITTCHKKL